MTSIQRYKTAKGTAWRVQYKDPTGRYRTKQGFKNKAEATLWAKANAAEIYTGQWANPIEGKTTIQALGTQWISTQTHLKPSTMRVTEQFWRLYVNPYWGQATVAEIKPSQVQAWVASIHKSPSTVRKAHACLAQILDVAVNDKIIKTNPARQVKLPRKNKAEKIFLAPGQLALLAGECSRHSELVWTLGTTGLRFSEAAGLRVKDIDVERRRINVERSAVTVGHAIHYGAPKSHERRTVAAPSMIIDMLRPLIADRPPNALVWHREDGQPLRIPTQGGWYYAALGRVMAKDPYFPRVTPHGLRHVAAGLMVAAGANVKVVQRQLGHASAAMTLDVYAALFDEDLDRVAGVMNDLLERRLVG